MNLNNRLLLAATSCLLLSNCGLIGTALRLAPYALMLADEDGQKKAAGTTLEMRAKQVEDRGMHGLQPPAGRPDTGLAFRR